MPREAGAGVPPHFDPLSTEQLTMIICRRFEEEPLVAFAEVAKFAGSGLYAIYYEGDTLPIYARLAGTRVPVYVGQGASASSATGRTRPSGNSLWERIRKHHASLRGASLPVREFRLALLRMPDVHVDLGENGLRVGYQPVWNSILTGFGSNEQGHSTRTSRRSKWDTVHPGRNRTFGPGAGHDAADLEARVQEAIARQVASAPALPWRPRPAP